MIGESTAGGAAITGVRHLHCNGLPLSYGGTPSCLLTQVRGLSLIAESAAGEAEITIVRHLHCNALPTELWGGTPCRWFNAGERGGTNR